MIRERPPLRILPRAAPPADLAATLSQQAPAQAAAPLGRTGPDRMSALLAARLSAWRELRSQWMLFLILPGLLAFGAAQPRHITEAIALFTLAVVVPILSVLVPLGRSGKSDAFWRGLGGPAWARLAGQLGLHALLLGLPVGALLIELSASDLQSTLLNAPEALLSMLLSGSACLYATTLAARARYTGAMVVVGPMLGLLAVGGGMLASHYWIQSLAPLDGMRLRAALVTSAALVAAWRWEATVGVWGAGVKRRGQLEAAAAVAVLLVASVALEAAWSRGPLPPGYRAAALAPDGSAAIFTNHTGRWGDASRAWVWREGRGFRRLAGLDVLRVSAGPGGAVLVVSGTDAPELILSTPGKTHRFPLPAEVSSWRPHRTWARWSPDGQQAVVELSGHSHLLSVTGTLAELAPLNGEAWLGGALAEQHGSTVRWQGQALELPTARDHIFDLAGAPWAILYTEQGVRYAPLSLEDGALVMGTPGERGELCGGSCPERPAQSARLDLWHAWLQGKGQVVALQDGTTWTLPAGHLTEPPALVGDGTVRVVSGREILTIPADP